MPWILERERERERQRREGVKRERERGGEWRVSDGPFSFIILWRGSSQMLKLCSVTKY